MPPCRRILPSRVLASKLSTALSRTEMGSWLWTPADICVHSMEFLWPHPPSSHKVNTCITGSVVFSFLPLLLFSFFLSFTSFLFLSLIYFLSFSFLLLYSCFVPFTVPFQQLYCLEKPEKQMQSWFLETPPEPQLCASCKRCCRPLVVKAHTHYTLWFGKQSEA